MLPDLSCSILIPTVLILEALLLTGTWFFFLTLQLILFFVRLQGTNIVDESHDQDTTDLHKCVSFVIRDLPIPDKSNVLQFNWAKHPLYLCNVSFNRFSCHFFNCTAVYSCSWCTWRKVWSWDGEHQCIVPLLKHQDRAPVRWLFNLSAPQDAYSRNPYWEIGRRSSLWFDSHWRTVD